jgi:hypothetical protein
MKGINLLTILIFGCIIISVNGDTQMITPKVNYLNNKDMLLEIHRSKSSYCVFTDPSFHQYDIILTGLDKINIRTVAEAKRNQAKRLGDLDYVKRKNEGEKIKQADCEVNYKSIPKTDLVFRIMTYDHIPLNSVRKKNPKTEADRREKVNFPPFQHYKFIDDKLVCVGKSHWKGDLETGHFEKTSGQITNTLARMMITLCERYATRGNVRGYTYNDEMRGQAILQLTQIGLQFDESKSDNPFAYFTAAVTNSFVRVINIEKRNQNIRDDILEMNGMNPSYTRTGSEEYEISLRRSEDYE